MHSTGWVTTGPTGIILNIHSLVRLVFYFYFLVLSWSSSIKTKANLSIVHHTFSATNCLWQVLGSMYRTSAEYQEMEVTCKRVNLKNLVDR